MKKHSSVGLCGSYYKHTQKVGSETGPRRIADSHYGTVDKSFYLVVILFGNYYIVVLYSQSNSETFESFGDYAEIAWRSIFNSNASTQNCSHANETSYLNHVGKYGVGCTVKHFSSRYCEKI